MCRVAFGGGLYTRSLNSKISHAIQQDMIYILHGAAVGSGLYNIFLQYISIIILIYIYNVLSGAAVGGGLHRAGQRGQGRVGGDPGGGNREIIII